MSASTVKIASYASPGYTMGYCLAGGGWKLRNIGELGVPGDHGPFFLS